MKVQELTCLACNGTMVLLSDCTKVEAMEFAESYGDRDEVSSSGATLCKDCSEAVHGDSEDRDTMFIVAELNPDDPVNVVSGRFMAIGLEDAYGLLSELLEKRVFEDIPIRAVLRTGDFEDFAKKHDLEVHESTAATWVAYRG